MVDVGDRVPAWQLTLADGGNLTSADLAGKRHILYFYPKADTPGCTVEAQDFSALMPQFTAHGVPVIAVSKDAPAKLAKFQAKYGLTVQLASDGEGALIEAMGVWVEKSNYGKKYMGIERSTFLIDGDGRVEQIWRKVRVKGHAEAVCAAIPSA